MVLKVGMTVHCHNACITLPYVWMDLVDSPIVVELVIKMNLLLQRKKLQKVEIDWHEN